MYDIGGVASSKLSSVVTQSEAIKQWEMHVKIMWLDTWMEDPRSQYFNDFLGVLIELLIVALTVI